MAYNETSLDTLCAALAYTMGIQPPEQRRQCAPQTAAADPAKKICHQQQCVGDVSVEYKQNVCINNNAHSLTPQTV